MGCKKMMECVFYQLLLFLANEWNTLINYLTMKKLFSFNVSDEKAIDLGVFYFYLS
jgi:hypothetical protein